MSKTKKIANNHTKITLEEVFDQHALNYIIQNADTLIEQIHEDRKGGFPYSIELCKKYLKKSKNGVITVSYIQTEDKAFYCEHSIGLQPMNREIRHTICKDKWVDMDMVNAEPKILNWFLCRIIGTESDSDSENDDDETDKNKDDTKKIKTPKGMKYFGEYITKRKQCLEQVIKDLKCDRERAKKAILCVLNSDDDGFIKNIDKSKFLQKLNKEIRKAFDSIVESKDYKKQFKKWVEETKEKDMKGPDRRKREKFPNYQSRFINDRFVKTKMCEILLFMYEKFGSPKRAVLCFDGIMLEKGKNYEDRIDAMMELVKAEFDIDIELKVKGFDEALDLSEVEIPNYEEAPGLIENPKHEIKETYGELDAEGKKIYDPKDPDSYSWVNFFKEFANAEFKTEQDMLLAIIPKMRKVFCQIVGADSTYILKESHEKPYRRTIMFSDLKKLCFTFEGDNKPVEIDLSGFIKKYAKYIPTYGGIICDPRNTNPDLFNLWRGPRFRILKEYTLSNGTKYDLTGTLTNEEKMAICQDMAVKLKLFLDYLRNQLCSDETECFLFMMALLAFYIKNPGMRSKICMVLFSAAQGTGKTTLIDFLMRYIFGPDNSFMLHSLDQACEPFNGLMSGKGFGVISDVGSNKNTWMKDHVKMKSLIDDSKILINKKGIDQYNEYNGINWTITTNAKNALHIPDKTDRKFFTPRNSEKNVNDKTYWDPFYETVFKQDYANMFATFVYMFDGYTDQDSKIYNWQEVNLKCPPLNSLKREMMGFSLKPTDKFFDDVKYSIAPEIKDSKGNVIKPQEDDDILIEYLKPSHHFVDKVVDGKIVYQTNTTVSVKEMKIAPTNEWGYDHVNKTITRDGIYKAFCHWCTNNNEKQKSSREFGEIAKERLVYLEGVRKYSIEKLEFSIPQTTK